MGRRVMLDLGNHHRVPRGKWHTWSPEARSIFNRVYEFMRDNEGVLLHPKQEPPKLAYWKTTAWNAAWIAADVHDGKTT